jgi:acetyl/propionyl-CoA carboxylase alpha subunit
MRKLGDKIGAKLIAEEAGVPVAPWSRGSVDNLDAAKRAAAEIGYPLMLKATAGGGGRGIRVVRSDDELTEAYERTSLEAERAFGSGVVFLERLVSGARHVEVQVIADGQGTAWALGVRDCSVQRRNQKVIEESASPVLAPAQVSELKAAAERLALAVEYRGAGTVEFLYHPGEKLFAFLEVNTRLQVEHPITEAPPTSTWSRRSSMWLPVAGSTGSRRARWDTLSRPGSMPRIPIATSLRRRAGSSAWRCPPALASGSTPASARAM